MDKQDIAIRPKMKPPVDARTAGNKKPVRRSAMTSADISTQISSNQRKILKILYESAGKKTKINADANRELLKMNLGVQKIAVKMPDTRQRSVVPLVGTQIDRTCIMNGIINQILMQYITKSSTN